MLISLLAVLAIGAVAWLGSDAGLWAVFGVVLPYAAVAIFLVGLVRRMQYWGKSPVPFAIPTTGGQQKSLYFFQQATLDNPDTQWGVVKRMLLEVFCFRSLFRNTAADVRVDGPRVIYYSSKWLWLFALMFHYCFLLIFIRHFRFFMEPVPACITWLETLDGIMQIGAPRLYATSMIILLALGFLLSRRLFNERLRYLSLPNDYFPLWLIIGIVGSGIWMRYFGKTDIASIKVFIMGLLTFSPTGASVDRIGGIFFAHLALVSCLLMYFPFSKLTHMLGVFFSPTRNLPNNTRAVRHVNPWNPPKSYHTYEEYEDDFRELMHEAGLPLDKQPSNAAAE
ncbi:MAG: sulfate reduction electron transfer complex DsrMKJOP subunit DsrM [Deltaproteobacteria bacterium]|jgi:nitrate reductase gamma subunit|nr:sulfate reduction electron transfer complex DsrMKJOP subunit DsrM [Deltaproteobacteria bacterium]